MIIVCEPQCSGANHGEVNAAFISVFSNAFTNEEVLFLGEKEHIGYIKNRLKDNELLLDNISFSELNIPPYFSSSFKRLRTEYKNVEKIFNIAEQNKCTRVVFLSVTSPGLYTIKLLLSKYKTVRPLIVLHSNFTTVFKRPSIRPYETLFWFRLSFFFKYNAKYVKYILLSPSIAQEVKKRLPKLTDKFFYIDLPYFFEKPYKYKPWKDDIIRFGALGFANRNKGTYMFKRIARESKLSGVDTKAEFIFIGKLNKRVIKNINNANIIISSHTTSLSRADYSYYTKKIDYAVFCYDKNSYKFTSSGALFDAFSYLKPIIALRSPLFEYYFKMMGDIGYLCEDEEDMKNIIFSIIQSRPINRYRMQRENLLVGRDKISIFEIANKIKRNIL